jgi:hypothetical protein
MICTDTPAVCHPDSSIAGASAHKQSTVLVYLRTVVAVYPWEAFEPAEDVHRRGRRPGPFAVYRVDGHLPEPVLGAVVDPQSLGWIEVGRVDGHEKPAALERNPGLRVDAEDLIAGASSTVQQLS